MTKSKAEANMAHNTVADKVMCGVAIFGVLALAFHDLLPHIKATQPVNFALAGGVVALLSYMIVAPLYRTK